MDRSAFVRDAVAASGGRVGGLEILRVEPHRYATSFPIHEITASEGEVSRGLLFKDLRREALSEEIRAAKPEFLFDPAREVAVYRTILTGAGLGTAECVGASDDPEPGAWLVLEHVRGDNLWQVGDPAVWLDVARWLARFHSRRFERSIPQATSRRLLRYDREHFGLWPARAQENGAGRSAADRRALDRVAGAHHRLVDDLTSMPSGFVHGEFYPSNVIVDVDGGDGIRVCAVDWEMAGIGPLLLDLAAFVEGWEEDVVCELAYTYRETALQYPGPPCGADELLAALDRCRLHLCMRWLGWAPGWEPPTDHDADWLALAVRLADRLAV